MDTRRLRLLPLAKYKLRYLAHLLVDRGDWGCARSYVWATLFSRDAGLALQDVFYRWFPFWGPYPQQLEIEVTTACNLKCVICEHTYWTERPKHITLAQFKAVTDQFPKLRWIGMTGIGSGFLNPQYMDMLWYAKTERKCFVEFFDHFLLMGEDISRELIRIGVNKIWVSLESADAESYDKVRVGSNFDKVIANIRGMIRAKRDLRSPIPELWFHFIINRHNIDQMEAYVELVADLTREERGLSAPLIYWTNLLTFDETAHLAVSPDSRRMADLHRLCRDRGIFSVANENTRCDKPMTSCTKWNEPFVLVTGHLQPCCALNEANDRPYQEANAFLNVFERDFRVWWRSEEKRLFIRNLKFGRVNPVCRDCHIFRHPDAAENVSIREYERSNRSLARNVAP